MPLCVSGPPRGDCFGRWWCPVFSWSGNHHHCTRVWINRIKMTFHPFSSAHLDFYLIPFVIWRLSSVRFTSETLQLLTNGAWMDHIHLLQTNCQVSKSWTRAGQVSVVKEWKQQETTWTDSLVWSREEFSAADGVLTPASSVLWHTSWVCYRSNQLICFWLLHSCLPVPPKFAGRGSSMDFFYLAHWVNSLLDICTFMFWDEMNLVCYQSDWGETTNIYYSIHFQRMVSLNPASCCMRHERGHLNVFMSLMMMVSPVLPSTAPGKQGNVGATSRRCSF